MFPRTNAARRREGGSSTQVLVPALEGGPLRCAAARKDLDNNHAAAAARAWRAMIGRGAWIGGVVHCRRFDLRRWSGHQLPGARNVGLAPDELVGGERHGAVPRPPVAAVILVPEGDAALVKSN